MPIAYKYHENTESRPRRISRVSQDRAKKLTSAEINSPAAIIGSVTPPSSTGSPSRQRLTSSRNAAPPIAGIALLIGRIAS